MPPPSVAPARWGPWPPPSAYRQTGGRHACWPAGAAPSPPPPPLPPASLSSPASSVGVVALAAAKTSGRAGKTRPKHRCLARVGPPRPPRRLHKRWRTARLRRGPTAHVSGPQQRSPRQTTGGAAAVADVGSRDVHRCCCFHHHRLRRSHAVVGDGGCRCEARPQNAHASAAPPPTSRRVGLVAAVSRSYVRLRAGRHPRPPTRAGCSAFS